MRGNKRFTTYLGSGCSSIDRTVAADIRDPRFESGHCQFYNCQLQLICIEKAKIKEKEAGNGPFKNNKFTTFLPNTLDKRQLAMAEQCDQMAI